MNRTFSRFLLPLLLSVAPMAAYSQSTYTAASANYADVNAVINGPTHVAVNGDTIQIPCSGTQSVVWTSSLAVSANITITGLGATPNAGASTFGAGTNCLTIRDEVSGGWLFYLTPHYAATNNVVTLQNMNIDPYTATTGLGNPITIEGTWAGSACPEARIDNIVFGNSVQWTESGNGAAAVQLIKPDNVCGVADHNTIPAGSAVELATIQMSSYLGVGQYGDNSWAQPDSMGGPNNWFDENNLINAYIVVTDATEGGPSYAESGGGRVVNRYNHIIATNMFQVTAVHGLDSTGRPRSARHTETYGNTITCSGNCSDATSYRGGTGVTWGNTLNVTGSGFWAAPFDVTIYRNALGNAPFSYCGGLATASGGNANPAFIGDPWDTIDNMAYYTGTMTTSGSGVLTMTDSSKSFPNLTAYSVYDTTQGFVSQITSNTSTSATVLGLVNVSTSGFNSGDSYKIIRATVCADQGGRGQGAYISTDPPPATALNEALDPIYEWDDTMQHGSLQVLLNYAGQIQANRDFYTDNWRAGNLSGPTAQTSPTSPFNGSTTCNDGSGNYTCGVGFGSLADRPTTCTIGVAYWATDQGSWNQSGSGSQGQLFKCTAANTWTLGYTPYAYPHPLVSGTTPTAQTPAPPTNLNGTVIQ